MAKDTPIPADLMRVLRLVDWGCAYICFDAPLHGIMFTTDGIVSPQLRMAYRALSGESQSVLQRAQLNIPSREQTALSRRVRDYMLWRMYRHE